MSYADFLAREEASEVKHEWHEDEGVFDMSGGTPEHSALSATFIAELHGALRGCPCRVYDSNMAVKIQAPKKRLVYPDASVVCGRVEVDPENPNALLNPVLIVEVLSDSTETYDRGKKFEYYRRIPSLETYVLISQHEPRIETFRRAGNVWTIGEIVGAGQTLDVLGVSVAVDAVYLDPLATASS